MALRFYRLQREGLSLIEQGWRSSASQVCIWSGIFLPTVKSYSCYNYFIDIELVASGCCATAYMYEGNKHHFFRNETNFADQKLLRQFTPSVMQKYSLVLSLFLLGFNSCKWNCSSVSDAKRVHYLFRILQ